MNQLVLSTPMTWLLIAANLTIFTLEVVLRQLGMSEGDLLRRFALHPDDLANGRYANLPLHLFSHAGLPHLFGNLLGLFVFGRIVERHLGPWRMLGCYLWAAACATALSLFAQSLQLEKTGVATLGASGAVAGLIALGVLFEPFALTFAWLIPLPLFVVGWLAMATDLLSLWHSAEGALRGQGRIDHPAHIGGYLSVTLYYFVLDRRKQERARMGLLLNLCAAFLIFTLWHVFG